MNAETRSPHYSSGSGPESSVPRAARDMNILILINPGLSYSIIQFLVVA